MFQDRVIIIKQPTFCFYACDIILKAIENEKSPAFDYENYIYFSNYS